MKSVGSLPGAFGRTASFVSVLMLGARFLSAAASLSSSSPSSPASLIVPHDSPLTTSYKPVVAPPSTSVQPMLPGAFAIPGIKRYQRADVDPVRMLGKVENLQAGNLPLDLGNGLRWDLDLERVSVRAPGYHVRLLTAQGPRDVAPGPYLAFRGRIHGKSGSKVRLTFTEGRITGFIDDGAGSRTFVEPLETLDSRLPRGAHAVYKQSDMELPAVAACGWTPDGALPDLQKLLPPGLSPFTPGSNGFKSGGGPIQAIPVPSGVGEGAGVGAYGNGSGVGSGSAGAAAEPCALVEIAVAAEYSMVKGWGTPAAVEKRINDIFTMVEGLYEDPRIDIHIRITELVIESGPNLTWGPMNINTYLSNITTWARGTTGFKNSYDVADLWYYDPLVSTSTTGLANVGTVCNKTSGGHVIRDFTKTASYLMINQAHELGHNFGANHVNNEKAILNPMILGDNTAWDDTPIAAILNHKHSRTCLSTCNLGPTANFLVNAKSPCSDTRTFTDASKGDPTSWSWNFGDGKSSKEQNPTHVYTSSGNFTAKLTATNAAGSDTASRGNINVKPYAAPTTTGARACASGPLTLQAAGAGTLKWYDQAEGGNKVGEGATFQTPSLAQTRIYYVEAGDPDLALNKIGPAGNTIGAGQSFVANADRRLYFDVNRPAILKTVKVYAVGAGPRTIDILDQGDVRVATRTVQVPAGESRITLNIELQPGHDYAIKYSGSPDSLNLYRNSAGAAFPYKSKDSLIAITHSDATPSDSTTQSGYYYFFYDWEIQERGCGSARTAAAAEITCVPIASLAPNGPASLLSLGSGRYRLAGYAQASQAVEFRLRYLDGREARRQTENIAPGAFAVDLDLAGLPSNLYLLEVKQGGLRILEKLVGF